MFWTLHFLICAGKTAVYEFYLNAVSLGAAVPDNVQCSDDELTLK